MTNRNIEWVLAAALVASATEAAPQDAARVAGDQVKVLLENDRVRVLEVVSKPGQKMAMHSHPHTVVYILEPARVRVTTPDGKTMDAAVKAGDVQWREPVTHAGENIGTTALREIIVEMKESPRPR